MLFSCKYCVISAWCLPRFFSLFFRFQKFNYVSWISLGFSFLRFTQLLKSVVLCFVPGLGSFHPLCLWIFSQSLLLSFGTPMTRISFCCGLTDPWDSVQFPFYILCLNWVNSVDLACVHRFCCLSFPLWLSSPAREVFSPLVSCN